MILVRLHLCSRLQTRQLIAVTGIVHSSDEIASSSNALNKVNTTPSDLNILYALRNPIQAVFSRSAVDGIKKAADLQDARLFDNLKYIMLEGTESAVRHALTLISDETLKRIEVSVDFDADSIIHQQGIDPANHIPEPTTARTPTYKLAIIDVDTYTNRFLCQPELLSYLATTHALEALVMDYIDSTCLRLVIQSASTRSIKAALNELATFFDDMDGRVWSDVTIEEGVESLRQKELLAKYCPRSSSRDIHPSRRPIGGIVDEASELSDRRGLYTYAL